MPRKSYETPKPSPRAPVNRTAISDESTQRPRSCYTTLYVFNQRLSNIKALNNWNNKTLEDKVVLKKMVDPFVLPKTEMIVDDSLSLTISRLIDELESYVICCGVEPNDAYCGKLLHHVIPTYTDSDVSETENF